MMATPANHDRQSATQPTCQNCRTSTTPLWRRDEYGAVLCNACGLFLKLHGRPRPISLKTDVIKSRNRVKAMRPDMPSKKKQPHVQPHGFSLTTDPHSVDAHNVASAAVRRVAGKSPDGHDDARRFASPTMYNPNIFSSMDEAQFSASGLASFATTGRPTSPMNGDRHLDASPKTHEQLIAINSSLKTRISELELINELFRGRLSQLEQDEASARRGQELSGQAETQLRAQLEASTTIETQLRAQLEDSHRRENNLKRRLDELELELKETKDALEAHESGRHPKKLRVESSESHAEATDTASSHVLDAISDYVTTEATASATATTTPPATDSLHSGDVNMETGDALSGVQVDASEALASGATGDASDPPVDSALTTDNVPLEPMMSETAEAQQ